MIQRSLKLMVRWVCGTWRCGTCPHRHAPHTCKAAQSALNQTRTPARNEETKPLFRPSTAKTQKKVLDSQVAFLSVTVPGLGGKVDGKKQKQLAIQGVCMRKKTTNAPPESRGFPGACFCIPHPHVVPAVLEAMSRKKCGGLVGRLAGCLIG